jgi:prepilin peptidase CpaA
VTPPLLFDALGLVAAATAAVTDVRSRRIPNWLTLPLACGAVGLHAAVGGGRDAGASLAGLFLAGLVPWVCFRLSHGRAIGGGDVKLFAALGALRGATEGLEILLSACVLVAVWALVRLTFAGRLGAVLVNSLHLVTNPLLPVRWRRPKREEALTEMRMGPAILGAVAYVCAIDRLTSWAPWLA